MRRLRRGENPMHVRLSTGGVGGIALCSIFVPVPRVAFVPKPSTTLNNRTT